MLFFCTKDSFLLLLTFIRSLQIGNLTNAAITQCTKQMNKVLSFIKDVFISLYQVGYIIFLLTRKLYRYLIKIDYKNCFKQEFIVKHKYLLGVVLGFIVVLISISSKGSNSSVGSVTTIFSNKTINQVITNELSDLEETKRLDKGITDFMKRWEIVGASLAVMKNNKLIYCKGYGYADKENEELCDVKHVFRVASISKLITAVAIMKLMEEKKLSLNSKVFGEKGILNEPRFTNFRDKRMKDITVEQLLRHSAGFSTRNGDPLFKTSMIGYVLNKKPPFTMDDVVEYGSRSPLRFKPGSGTNYSNLGYVILSKIIENVTGMEYEEYVKKHILAPLGCYDMHIANNSSKDKFKNEVRYYEPSNEVQFEDEDGNLIPKSDGGNDVRLLSGAGAWVGSPVEILKFVAAVDGLPSVKDILKPSSIRYMTEPSKGKLPIGWIKTNNREWLRTGSMAGTSAMIKHTKGGYTWMLVTNTSSWKGSRFPTEINSSVRKAMGKVNQWPERDIFEIAEGIIGN